MIRKAVTALASGLLAAALAVAIFVAPGQAATPAGAHPVESTCNQGWYVNQDEVSLLPLQTEEGFLFDGPSLVHHGADILLVELLAGAFTVDVKLGVAPLFKVETSPYSTLNYVGDGKWWSSRIAPGDTGGMDHPVTPAVMATLPIIDKSWDDATSYSATTKVVSFGVGYANDTGNKALVSSITFQGTEYDLTCEPEPSPDPTTPSPSTPAPSSSATTPPAGDPTPDATDPPVAGGPNLPITGVDLADVVTGGILLLIGGAMVWLLAGARPRPRTNTTPSTRVEWPGE